MTQHLSRCAIAVPRAPFESMQLQQFANAPKSLPCGLVTGKSLMSVAIVVENTLRPVKCRSVDCRLPRKAINLLYSIARFSWSSPR